MHCSFQPEPCLGSYFRRPTVRPILLDRVQLLHECPPPPRLFSAGWSHASGRRVDLERVEVHVESFVEYNHVYVNAAKRGGPRDVKNVYRRYAVKWI